MITGSLPPASIWGTWLDYIEVFSADDDTLYDLSSVTEIKLRVIDPVSMIDELTLSMTNGDIVTPSLGIIQWRAEVGQMGTLTAKTYKVVMTIEDETDTVPLIQGIVSIVE